MATLSINGLHSSLERLSLDTPLPSFPPADVLVRPLDIFRSYIAKIVAEVTGCDPALAYEAIQTTAAISMGDLAVILPRLKIKANAEVAAELLAKFPKSPLYTFPFVDGIHIRIFSSPFTLPRLLLPFIADRKELYGGDESFGLRPAPDSGKLKAIVEFSSPNIASEFEGRHLRSTINGAAIANLYERMGWDVVRMNYLGDWGKQVALLAVGWEKFGSDEEFEKDAIRHLLEVYNKIVEAFKPELEASHKAKADNKSTAEIESQGIYAERDAFFKRLEDGDADAMALWKKFRDVYVEDYTKAYARLGIKFDEYNGESQVTSESIAEVEAVLKDKGVLEESEGSWVIDFKKHGSKGLSTAVLRNRTGTTMYLLRDIANVIDLDKKHSFDKLIYVVTSDQDAHFARVAKAIELMGHVDLAKKLQHVGFGKVQGLSAQLGNAHLFGDMIDQCAAAVKTAMAEQESGAPASAAEPFGITSLIAQDMHTKRGNGYAFDSKKMTEFEGDTGAALQFAYTRLKLALGQLEADPTALADVDYTHLQEEEYTNLLRLMAQYPDVINAAYKSVEPSAVLSFLYRLVEQLIECLDVDEDEEAPEGSEVDLARAVLYENAKQVLENGMKVLGTAVITPVERARRAERAKEKIREEVTFTPALLGRVQSRVDANAFRRCISDNTIYQSICNSLKDQNLPERERRPDLVDFLALEAILPVQYNGQYNKVLKDLFVRCHTISWVKEAILKANHDWFQDQLKESKDFIRTMINKVDSQLLEIILEDIETSFWRENIKDHVLYKKVYHKLLSDTALTQRDVLTVVAINGGRYPTEIFRHLVIKQNSDMLNFGNNMHARHDLYEDEEYRGSAPAYIPQASNTLQSQAPTAAPTSSAASATDGIADLEAIAEAMGDKNKSREMRKKIQEMKELMGGDSLRTVRGGRVQKPQRSTQGRQVMQSIEEDDDDEDDDEVATKKEQVSPATKAAPARAKGGRKTG
ncbi:Arginine--tRNA ligase cytoplasmic [Colletotrichum gloeosporioides]|uniref:arginine--tRNA ligase n=1 Tax=Colletotrichum gloeosporioides TaxID=474922 RepID=A0A8H4FLV0_COLGL|nr:Arginine--tRNA ligase cytoplasmic [Colletotrichum gloeosporioides]KAF3806870.1 Arginine--tRNA ligase cytoplasmic [Colletotrichum gloeosporioides]